MNPNPVTLIDLVEQYTKQLNGQLFTLRILDASNHKQHVIVNNGKSSINIHQIIYDPQSSLDLSEYDDSYYCNDLEDLTTILQFIYKHPEMFTTISPDDVYDNCEVITFTDLLSSDSGKNDLVY